MFPTESFPRQTQDASARSPRVLLLTASEGQAERWEGTLEASGLAAEWRRAGNAATFAFELGQGPDLVLAASDVFGGDIEAVLRPIRQAGGDLPLVILVPKAVDGVLLECFRQGATDCVPEGQLEQLPARVWQALKSAEARRTERLAVDALRRSEAQYRRLVESTDETIGTFDARGVLGFINDHGAAAFDQPKEILQGQTMWDLFPKTLADRQMAIVRQVIETGATVTRETRIVLQGQSRWCRLSVEPLREPDGRIRQVLFLARDVTDLKRSEMERARLAHILEDSRSEIYLINAQTLRFVHVNLGARENLGYTMVELTELTPLALQEEYTPETYAALLRPLHQGQLQGIRYETSFRRKDGSTYPVDVFLQLFAHESEPLFLAVALDITDKKRLENQYLRAQRLESVGTLAAGIAHDLNNMLAPVLMAVSELRREPLTPDGLTLLESIETCTQRSADIVKQVLSFARGSQSAPVLVHPKRQIENLMRLIRETFPRSVTIRHSLPTYVWPIVADPTRLQQVLMNLCVNARDAMPNGGELSLSLDQVVLDEAAPRKQRNAHPGPYVVIRVSDTGTGMTPDVMDRIYDPFFTTKPPGQGTGLGLATVLGIVEGHGGFVDVTSEVGRGTTFSVWFPARPDAEEAPEPRPELSPPQGRGELLLVVDDEPAVLRMTQMMLKRCGYRVMTAANGHEAASLYQAYRQEIRVVITDLMMPGRDGLQLIQDVLAQDPGARIMAVTGLAETAKSEQALRLGVRTSLAKPFSAQELVSAVRQVLDTDE